MKMPRSQCESENVQFVQELAEVDGPFEAPININFRDLTKLELPSLVWNRGDTCPKKMKITNTGHTVIVSGKWKCERPYLTGGPLLGKYVFSQIHFHWGQDDCKGSEHQICGEGFPLEMHVAHFKTEYLTQECALREKDGMVVVVYLFKLQEEPNQSLKKIINSLPNVKQPSTSQAIDPRPILTLCNPFTDDYFMYWGSVVTSTCAHILLWIICREPFGISREQVNEFRKIMDSGHQPIFRNNRDIQPIHKRNVFHVNASKHLDEPLLPVKKLLGCYCKGSEDNGIVKHSNDCNCRVNLENQEDVEGSLIERIRGNQGLDSGGMQALHFEATLPSTCFANQTFFVHTAQIQSVSIVLKRCGSDPLGNYCRLDKKVKSEDFKEKSLKEFKENQIKFITQSCCFLPLTEAKKIKTLAENRKTQERKKLFNSMKAFSQIMQSLETLKNHTFKKLKEIESINQEIKEMKPYCQNTEEKKWIRRIEKMMKRQKRLTMKSSQGCLSEIRKFAKDCNFDKYFDVKALSDVDRNQKEWMNNDEITKGLLCSDNYIKGEGIPEIRKSISKYLDINKGARFSSETQKLIESFFEDIKDNEDLQETIKKDLNLKKIKSFYSKQEDSNPIGNESKGYITQKMFTLGNLGNRFFTEVTTEDCVMDANQWVNEKLYERLVNTEEVNETKNTLEKFEDEKTAAPDEHEIKPKIEALIPLHRANVVILPPKTNLEKTDTLETVAHEDLLLSNEEKTMSHSEIHGDMESVSNDEKFSPKNKSRKISLKKSASTKCKKLELLMNERLMEALEAKVLLSKRSGSNFSSESNEIQRTIFSKIRKSTKGSWEYKRQKSSSLLRVSSKRSYNRGHCKKFESYYIQKKDPKIKKRKNCKSENMKLTSLHGLSSTSLEDRNPMVNKQKWKRMTKAKFKLKIGKTSDSTSESVIENILISPDRKRLKLENKKFREYSSRENSRIVVNSNDYLTDTEILPITNGSPLRKKSESAQTKKTAEQEYSAVKPLKENFIERQKSYAPERTKEESRNVSRSSSNRSLRDGWVDSKVSRVKSEQLIKSDTCDVSLDAVNETLKGKPENLPETKPMAKNKILSNVTNAAEFPIESAQKIHVESLDDRRKSNKDSFIPRRIILSPRKIKERLKNTNVSNLSNETCKKPDGELQDSKTLNRGFESKPQTPTKFEYEVGFFTTSSQVDNELLPLDQARLEKGKLLKHSGAKKYQPTRKSPRSQGLNDEHPEILHRTDSNKSFAKDASKGNADSLTLESKDLQTSVSCSTLKKSSLSRPHSAESLHSQTKKLKRKGKKRPHCSKRKSRHYLRKNSWIFKKPNKAEKPLNFLNLTNEEQLKIISVNVARYIKEKLAGENEESVSKINSSSNNTEEVSVKAENLFQEKKEDTNVKTPSVNKDLDKKSDKTSEVKATDKKEGKSKRTGTLSKPKVIKTHNEVQEEKSIAAPPKPVNNFIKLNKQMAGKYKKLLPLSVKKVESKERLKIKQKFKLEAKPLTEAGKPKAKSPKKKKEEVTSPEPKEQLDPRAETPKSSRSSQLLPKRNSQKKNQTKSPRTLKKTDTNAKEPSVKSESPTPIEESNQPMKCESKLSALPPSSALQKIPRPKKCLIPTCMLSSYLPSPVEPVENQTRKMNRCILSMNKTKIDVLQPELLYESKSKSQEDIKTENLLDEELEYFIKLQMHFNNDISTDLENPLPYVKSKLLQKEQRPTNFQVNDSLQNFDLDIRRTDLMDTKDLAKYSNSCSEFTEDVAKHKSGINAVHDRNESNFKNKEIVSVKTMLESEDSRNETPKFGKEKQEETNSDSSYDCKISITLNTNSKDCDNTIESCDPGNWLGENSSYGQKIRLEEIISQSTVTTKSFPKKRNESDIPIEMKEKLLEILEGEIKRGVAIKCGGSPGNSSDGFTFKEEDSDGNNRSRSTESSCDNIDVLAQISNTMRQYLTYMKQLPEKESQVFDES